MTQRFAFGENWSTFVTQHLTEERIQQSQDTLCRFLGHNVQDISPLAGLSFLDIGCGSGLSSLAAWRLGATKIISFDYDPQSVAATRQVHAYAGHPDNWRIMQGDVLDNDFMRRIPQADIVYSWGVLHHTGNMRQAIDHAAACCRPGGFLYLALYSYAAYLHGAICDAAPTPEEWLAIKQRYLHGGALRRRLMEYGHVWRTYCKNANIVTGIRSFWREVHSYGKNDRGMRFWTDLRDWLGGWPMEFVHERTLCQQLCKQHSYELLRMDTGKGNTSFLFRKPGNSYPPPPNKNRAMLNWHDILNKRVYTLLRQPFSHVKGNMYACSFKQPSDIPPWRLRMKEEGEWLAFANAPHEAIAQVGEGRYSFWGDTLYFSTSDNSDPNTNGRQYCWFADIN